MPRYISRRQQQEKKSHINKRHIVKNIHIKKIKIKASDLLQSLELGGVNKDMLTSINSKSSIDKTEVKELTSQKKTLFKNMIGKYSTKVDMNKIREEYKR